jgi:ABC-type dipeptide/oligopeptide/nickel transport system ATPase component
LGLAGECGPVGRAGAIEGPPTLPERRTEPIRGGRVVMICPNPASAPNPSMTIRRQMTAAQALRQGRSLGRVARDVGEGDDGCSHRARSRSSHGRGADRGAPRRAGAR